MTSTSVPLQSKSGTQIIGVLPAGARLLEYEIVRVLGRPGGFGVTYLAIDSNLQKEVAIKEYLPVDFAIRTSDDSISTRSEEDQPAFEWGLRCFLNEARVLAKFRHPNVVQVYRLFEAQKTAYIVLEHVQGQTLSEYLNARPGLDQRGIDAFLLPLLDGLAEVHAAGILHRDLKPENVLVRPDGSPVLIDFGAARNAIGGRSRSIMSVLTTGYAPIEQYSDNGLQGAWTDIYALGAVIYRAIIGRKPADAIDRLGRDPVEHLAESPRAGFDTSFLQAVDWALRVRADERPATVADWREALAGRRAPPAAPAHAQTPLLGTTTVDLDLDGRSTTRQAPSGEPPLLAAAPAEERTSPRPSISMAMPVPGIPTGEPLSQSDSRSTGVSRSSGSALPPDERTVIYRQPSPPAPSESSAVSASPPSAPSVSRARVTPVADRTTEPSSLLSGDGNAIAAPAAATPSAAAERLPPSKPPTPAAVATAAKPRWLKPAAVAAGIIVPLIGLVLFWPHGQPAPTDDASTVPAQEVAPARGSPLADAVQTPAETGANTAVSSSALPSGADETPATGTQAPPQPILATPADIPPTPPASGALTTTPAAPQATPATPPSAAGKAEKNPGKTKNKRGAETAAVPTPEPTPAPAVADALAGLEGKWTVESPAHEVDAGNGCRATATQRWTLNVAEPGVAPTGSYAAEWHAVWMPKWGCKFFNNSADARGQFRVTAGSGDRHAINLASAKCSGDCDRAHAMGFIDGGAWALRSVPGDSQRFMLQIGEQTFELRRGAR